MSFSFTVGILMVLLACALPQYDNWYPMFVLLTYAFAPVPAMIIKRYGDLDYSESTVGKDVATFITSALVCSGYGIPWVLWHGKIIVTGAAWLVVSGNTIIFLTILAYFAFFEANDGYSSMY